MATEKRRQVLKPLQDVLRKEALEALKDKLNGDSLINKNGKKLEIALERFNYALYAVGINPYGNREDAYLFEKLNAEVRNRVKIVAESGVQDKDAKEHIRAFLEFMNSGNMRGREWRAVTTTLSEPNPGLRTSPYIVSHLITDGNVIDTIKKHKGLVEEFSSGEAKISYKGRVKNLDHVVYFVEEGRNFKTGETDSLYFYTLLHFKRDSFVMRIPEYEPITHKLVPDEDGIWRATKASVRVHWFHLVTDLDKSEKTPEGALEVTSIQDLHIRGMTVALGHELVIVDKRYIDSIASDLENTQDWKGAANFIRSIGPLLFVAVTTKLSKIAYGRSPAHELQEEPVMEGGTAATNRPFWCGLERPSRSGK